MPASLVAGLVLNSFGTHAFCRTATTNPPVHSLKFQQRKGFCRTRSRVWSSWLWKRGGTMVESPPAELLSRRLGWLAGRERRATCSEKEKVPPHFERGKSSLHLFSVPFLFFFFFLQRDRRPISEVAHVRACFCLWYIVFLAASSVPCIDTTGSHGGRLKVHRDSDRGTKKNREH